jgi:hypothetical protein
MPLKNAIKIIEKEGGNEEIKETVRWLFHRGTVDKLQAANVVNTEQFLSLSELPFFACFCPKLEVYQINLLRTLLKNFGFSADQNSVAVLNSWLSDWERTVIKEICRQSSYHLKDGEKAYFDLLRRKVILHLGLESSKVSVTDKNLPRFRKLFEPVLNDY